MGGGGYTLRKLPLREKGEGRGCGGARPRSEIVNDGVSLNGRGGPLPSHSFFSSFVPSFFFFFPFSRTTGGGERRGWAGRGRGKGLLSSPVLKPVILLARPWLPPVDLHRRPPRSEERVGTTRGVFEKAGIVPARAPKSTPTSTFGMAQPWVPSFPSSPPPALPFHNGCSKVGSAGNGLLGRCSLAWGWSGCAGLRAEGGLSFWGVSIGSPAGREDRGKGEGRDRRVRRRWAIPGVSEAQGIKTLGWDAPRRVECPREGTNVRCEI